MVPNHQSEMFKKSVVIFAWKIIELPLVIIGGFPSVIGDGDFPMGKKGDFISENDDFFPWD